jgi:peptide/nickel transport system ATP-binding protein
MKISNVSYVVESKKNIISRPVPKNILKDINFDIKESEFLAVAGPSGSGKSTLAKIISGIIQPSAGEITFENIKPDEIQILFQNNNELVNPNRKVGHIINESINIANSKKDSLQIKKEDLLNLLEIPESLFVKRGFELSGGQKQKVGLARV